MLYKSLDGKEHKLNTTKYLKQSKNKSKLHLRVREFLKKTFPMYSILEEVGVKVDKNTLYFDFMIPQLNYIFECQGEQHHKHISFFHKSKADFLKAKQRDVLKKQLSCLNGWDLIELNWNESEEDWKDKIVKVNE